MVHSWGIRGENQEIVRDLEGSAFRCYELIPNKKLIVFSQAENLFVFFKNLNFDNFIKKMDFDKNL